MPFSRAPGPSRLRHGVGRGVVALAGVVCLAGCGQSAIAKQPPAVTPTGAPVARRTEIQLVAEPGPPGARAQRSIAAACPSGLSLLAGGAEAYLADGKAPNPSLRLVATVPDGTGGSARWDAIIATGGVTQSDSRIASMALCGQVNPPATVVVKAVPGPQAAASNALATATCPRGMVLVGGGAAVSLTNGQPGPPQYFVTASFPSRATGAPATTGTAPTSWTAIGALGGAPMAGGQLTSVADCVPGTAPSVTVVVNTQAGPSTPQTAKEVTATCPRHSTVVGGGVYTGPSELEHTLMGLHLRGSFPSTATGTPAGSGTSATSWSVIANSGGVIAVGARTTSFALCTAE
jgi:hypothetical protein